MDDLNEGLRPVLPMVFSNYRSEYGKLAVRTVEETRKVGYCQLFVSTQGWHSDYQPGSVNQNS